MKKKTAGIWLTIGILTLALVAGFVTRTLPTKEEKLAEMQAAYEQEVAMAQSHSESTVEKIDLEGQEEVPAAPSTDGTSIEDETSANAVTSTTVKPSEVGGDLTQKTVAASKVALGESNRVQKVVSTTKAPVTTGATVEAATTGQTVTEVGTVTETTVPPTTTSGSWVQ